MRFSNFTASLKKILSVFLMLFIFANISFGQKDSTKLRLKFMEPAPSFDKYRTIGVSAGLSASYIGSMLALNELWYTHARKSKFHFHDDSREWLQVDKMGHFHTTYMEAVWLTKLMKWTGTKDRKSALTGSLLALGFQTSIEFFDGFSLKWGASVSDIGANFLGASLAYTQFYFWNEQRIKTKYGFHTVTHADSELQQRSADLYGTNPVSSIIKDYNGIIIWLSVNPSSFSKNPTVVPWLSFALGYAGGGLYGGKGNVWQNSKGKTISRFEVERYRRFFISADVDWDRIPTKSPYVKTLFTFLNIVKVPFPAMEFNTKGQVVFHPMLFLNWNTPIYFKK